MNPNVILIYLFLMETGFDLSTLESHRLPKKEKDISYDTHKK